MCCTRLDADGIHAYAAAMQAIIEVLHEHWPVPLHAKCPCHSSHPILCEHYVHMTGGYPQQRRIGACSPQQACVQQRPANRHMHFSLVRPLAGSTGAPHLELAVQHHHVEEVVREGERHGRSRQHSAAGRAEGALFQLAGQAATWRAALPWETAFRVQRWPATQAGTR